MYPSDFTGSIYVRRTNTVNTQNRNVPKSPSVWMPLFPTPQSLSVLLPRPPQLRPAARGVRGRPGQGSPGFRTSPFPKDLCVNSTTSKDSEANTESVAKTRSRRRVVPDAIVASPPPDWECPGRLVRGVGRASRRRVGSSTSRRGPVGEGTERARCGGEGEEGGRRKDSSRLKRFRRALCVPSGRNA